MNEDVFKYVVSIMVNGALEEENEFPFYDDAHECYHQWIEQNEQCNDCDITISLYDAVTNQNLEVWNNEDIRLN